MNPVIKKRLYAKQQNAMYDPLIGPDGAILYGVNRDMHPLGVNDGILAHTVNPLLTTPQYACSTGTAGGPTEYFSNMTEDVNTVLIILIVCILGYLVYKQT